MTGNQLSEPLQLTLCGEAEGPKSFDEVYHCYRLSIFRFIISQGVSPEVAQDLTQEVFLRRLHAARLEKQIDSNQAWLFGVAAKVTIDHWRRDGSPRWLSIDSPTLHQSAITCSQPSPEQAYGTKQKIDRVAEAMKRLPVEQRMTIELRLKGLRYKQIGSALSVSTSTVATWLSTAVEQLRKAAHE